jgi:membrane protein implicated in regulation of membrane protease activity
MGPFTKFLLVVAVIALAWFGWRWWQRYEKERRELEERREAEASLRRARGDSATPIEDLVKCRICGAFVPPRAARCERTDCPR